MFEQGPQPPTHPRYVSAPPNAPNRNPWWAAVLIGMFAIFVLTRDGSSTSGALTAMLILGVPLVLVVLIVRALYRVGEPRPAPITFVTPSVPPGTRSAPPPGWYNNPDGADERWWDGRDWTAHTRRPN